jgi:hypothetical protein
MKQVLETTLEQLNLGLPFVFSYDGSDPSIEVNGDVAWATYDSTFKYGLATGDMKTIHEKCTSILKRNGSSWLFVHDHCSTIKKTHSSSPRMDNN